MTWEDRLKQLISPTENKFLYRVVQIKPNRKRDDEIYLLSGREEDIAANGSLFLALYDLAERDRLNFEEWFAEWELGFPAHNQFREPENSNYPLSGEKPWRVPDRRPKYRDLTPPELRRKINFRVIEYWPDRSIESKSILFSGTDTQLIQHIVQLEYEASGTTKSEEKVNYLTRSRRGYPLVKCYFKEDTQDVEPGYRAVEAELNFRIMKENMKDISLISSGDLRQIATAVKSIFFNFTIRKGKLTCSYKNLEQGYDNWLYVRNKEEGARVITALVSIQGHTLDRRFLKFTETDDEISAYPTIPPTQAVFGRQMKADRKKPIAEVKFSYSKIFLPGLNNPLILVDSAGVVFDSDNLLP